MLVDRRAMVLAGAAALAAAPAFAQGVVPSAADPRPQTYELLNQAAPPFDLEKLGGGRARLSDYRGRTLILYWWGLWCPDCLADGAYTASLARQAQAVEGLSFLAIHTRGRFGRWGSVPSYFEERGYGWPVAFEHGRDFARNVYRIGWFPTYLVIDRQGVIRHWRTDLGAAGGDGLLAQARALARG
jgi:thiol-disulfide isomerase/thioredoxin